MKGKMLFDTGGTGKEVFGNNHKKGGDIYGGGTDQPQQYAIGNIEQIQSTKDNNTDNAKQPSYDHQEDQESVAFAFLNILKST